MGAVVKAQDLPAPDRRLLRHCGRIDPNPCVTMPGEWKSAERLAQAGLIAVVPTPPRDRYRITDAGRDALR